MYDRKSIRFDSNHEKMDTNRTSGELPLNR